MKRIFIICTVRGASPEYKKKLEDYVKYLESEGREVHLPHRDTDQTKSGYEICHQNARAIAMADEVHVFYNPESLGTHFDMGVAFAYGKKVVIVEMIEGQGKFTQMLKDWAKIYSEEYPIETLLEMKEKQLQLIKDQNKSLWEMYGSELCVKDLLDKEEYIEHEIANLKKKLKCLK